MRKLAYIAEVSSVEPIEGADRLEQVMLKGHGWKIVTAKGDFSVGDLGVMFEIDSYLPIEDERYAFLKDRCLRKFVSKSGNVLREGIRIKTCKLRGVISQGLLMKIDNFPEIKSRSVRRVCFGDKHAIEFRDVYFISKTKDEWIQENPEQAEKADAIYRITDYLDPLVGADVTKLLNVEHYDEVKEQLQPQSGNAMSADAKGSFPSSFIPKTDEERIQNLGDWFDTMKGRKWQVSVKADGTSCTIAYSPTIDPDEPAVVCSRNLRLKKPTEETATVPIYWQMAYKYNILGKLAEVVEGSKEYAIQGEIVGPGIQKCRNKEVEAQFKCFRIYDIAHQKFLNPNETVAFCKEFDIPHVDIIETDFPFFDKITTMEEALKFAEGKTKEGNEREGVVCKTCDNGEYASFKVVSNKYLMKQED